MTIKFEIYSDKEMDRALVRRYWERDEEGKFVEKVSDLLPFGEIKNSSQLVYYINKISKAWDEKFQCSRCEEHQVISSRADYSSSKGMVCRDCIQKEKEANEERRRKEVERLNEKLDEITEKNSSLRLNYTNLKDDEALLLLALSKSINPRLTFNTFKLSSSTGVAPTDTFYFIEKLYDCGALTHYPPHASPNAYILKEEGVSLYLSRVAFMLVPDVSLGRGEELFELLSIREYKQFSRISQLWLDYAVSDCMAYLYSECSLHGLETDTEDDLKIKSILRTALETYSIAQLWSVIWKIVRDAASLSTRVYYNKAKAAATLPGKIKRYLEQQIKEGTTLKSWERPNHQPAGTLGDIFYEYFGIDEQTPGFEVMEMFSESSEEDEVAWLEESASHIMERALVLGLETRFLIDFAEHVRCGKSVVEALTSLVESYPELDDVM